MVVDALPKLPTTSTVRTSLGTRKPLPRNPQAASKPQSPKSQVTISRAFQCRLQYQPHALLNTLSAYHTVFVLLSRCTASDLDFRHFNESGRPHALRQNTNHSIMTDQRPDLASNRHQLAEWLTVSSDRVVTVEHPSIVQDIDKGLQSLGGEHHIKHVGPKLFLKSTMPCHLIDLL